MLLLVSGEVNGSILLEGGISLAVTAGAGIAGYCFLRGERSARWLGAKPQRPLSWILVKLKRDPLEDGAGRAAELRANTLTVLREGWVLGSIGVAANLLVTYLILLAALRFVGASGSELSAVDAFAAFAVAFWAGAVFPVTGSGLGVVDAVLIAVLVELSSVSDDVLVAAVLLWRVFYSLISLPRRDHVEPVPQDRPRRAGARHGGDRVDAGRRRHSAWGVGPAVTRPAPSPR